MAGSIAMLDFIAPEFEGEDTATKTTALQMAAARISAKAWGSLYSQAATYLAAHILKIRQRGSSDFSAAGFIGAVTSIKTGDLSVSGPGFVGQDGDEASLKSTEYGQAYLELRGSIPLSPFISEPFSWPGSNC